MGSITFYDFFAVFDLSPLTLCINCIVYWYLLLKESENNRRPLGTKPGRRKEHCRSWSAGSSRWRSFPSTYFDSPLRRRWPTSWWRYRLRRHTNEICRRTGWRPWCWIWARRRGRPVERWRWPGLPGSARSPRPASAHGAVVCRHLANWTKHTRRRPSPILAYSLHYMTSSTEPVVHDVSRCCIASSRDHKLHAQEFGEIWTYGFWDMLASKQSNKQTNRETNRQTNTHTDRNTSLPTYRGQSNSQSVKQYNQANNQTAFIVCLLYTHLYFVIKTAVQHGK